MQLSPRTRKAIQPLPPQLANQIAAGEVVERPASVVKELLENSLDAAATQIEIDIQAGGTRLIRIRDNGCGIPRDELPLALSPHATSKIYSLDDLVNIRSMGFRGEALASIASVSEMVMTSSIGESGWSIRSLQQDLKPASHPPGTTVEVHNLFYNTPARRKFLKAERTEFRHIEDVVRRLALARFDVAFSFRHNQRQVFSLPVANSAQSRLQRLSRLLGKGFVDAAFELDYDNAGLSLSGWIAGPAFSRSQSDMQYFFVNGRMIRDKLITHAVRQAFQDSLYPGRYPVYVLNLQMEPEQVDVNVHPAKSEVRFRQGRLVHDFLFYSLRDALSQQGSTQPAVTTKASFPAFNAGNYRPAAHHFVEEQATTYAASSAHRLQSSEYIDTQLGQGIALFENRYLLSQNQQGLLVIQLDPLRKRLFQQRMEQALASETGIVSKPVLIPFSVAIEQPAADWLQQYQAPLSQLGFELDQLGEKAVMVRQVPAMLQHSDIREAVEKYLQQIEPGIELRTALLDIMLEEAVADDPDEWNSLLRELEEKELAEPEVHYHQLSSDDFARWFSR